ncbi:MAG: hypothetical protein K0U66_02020 [Gammaproteobacteria bacterium]|nr:hypothetical protein [Gammaproteobacteria bacterium]
MTEMKMYRHDNKQEKRGAEQKTAPPTTVTAQTRQRQIHSPNTSGFGHCGHSSANVRSRGQKISRINPKAFSATRRLALIALSYAAPAAASVPNFIASAGDAKSFVEGRAATIIDGLQLIALSIVAYFGIWAGIRISQGDQNGKTMLISALVGGIIAMGITQIVKFVLIS